MTNYEIVEPIVDFDSSSQVIVNVIAVGYLINIMNDWHNVGNLPNLLLNITYWWQLGLAKYHWNQREEHDIETRQSSATTEDAGRPEDFQSGPSLFLLER